MPTTSTVSYLRAELISNAAAVVLLFTAFPRLRPEGRLDCIRKFSQFGTTHCETFKNQLRLFVDCSATQSELETPINIDFGSMLEMFDGDELTEVAVGPPYVPVAPTVRTELKLTGL